MADARRAAIVQSLIGEDGVDGRQTFRLFGQNLVHVEEVERAGIADGHQGQVVGFGERQQPRVQGQKQVWIDGAQFTAAGAARRRQLDKLEADIGRNNVGCGVQLLASALRRTTWIVGESHGRPPRTAAKTCRICAMSGRRNPNRVLSGSILPRRQSLSTRNGCRSAARRCTPRISADGSMRPRARTIARKTRAWRLLRTTLLKASAFSGSIAPVTIGIETGQTS